jgi:two-component system nitrogen regulation response regulator GlnG
VLRGYSWPGNLRELQSVLKEALLRASGPVLVPDFLPASLGAGSSPPAGPQAALGDWDAFLEGRLQAGSHHLYEEWLTRAERHLIRRVLERTHGNQAQAAKILGITRLTLRTKIRSLGITIDRSVRSEGDRPDK